MTDRAEFLIARAKRGEGRKAVAAVVRHYERRSITPTPATLPLADVARLDAVRWRLVVALRTADTLPALRECVASLASDLEDVLFPLHTVTYPAAPLPADDAPDTIPAPGAPWDDDAAPSTPRDSALGEEYGI